MQPAVDETAPDGTLPDADIGAIVLGGLALEAGLIVLVMAVTTSTRSS